MGCPGLIPGLFIYLFICVPPFFGGLPRVNTRVIYLINYFILFSTLFWQAAVVDAADVSSCSVLLRMDPRIGRK
jgi:hypothetical protein